MSTEAIIVIIICVCVIAGFATRVAGLWNKAKKK
jgi:hypothetical protein